MCQTNLQIRAWSMAACGCMSHPAPWRSQLTAACVVIIGVSHLLHMCSISQWGGLWLHARMHAPGCVQPGRCAARHALQIDAGCVADEVAARAACAQLAQRLGGGGPAAPEFRALEGERACCDMSCCLRQSRTFNIGQRNCTHLGLLLHRQRHMLDMPLPVDAELHGVCVQGICVAAGIHSPLHTAGVAAHCTIL